MVAGHRFRPFLVSTTTVPIRLVGPTFRFAEGRRAEEFPRRIRMSRTVGDVADLSALGSQVIALAVRSTDFRAALIFAR